jgi:hypothetical protein
MLHAPLLRIQLHLLGCAHAASRQAAVYSARLHAAAAGVLSHVHHRSIHAEDKEDDELDDVAREGRRPKGVHVNRITVK